VFLFSEKETAMFAPAATFVILAIGLVASGIKILKEYERGVIFRLGRLVTRAVPASSM